MTDSTTQAVYSYLGPAGTFTEDALRQVDPEHLLSLIHI